MSRNIFVKFIKIGKAIGFYRVPTFLTTLAVMHPRIHLKERDRCKNIYIITVEKIDRITYWKDSAEHDLPVIDDLFNSGRYDWALFIGHLVLEKILKARWVFDNNDDPPKTHNLSQLARRTKLNISEDLSLWLLQVNDFNLETRYPDYKHEFHKSVTKEFTLVQLDKIKETYQWIAKSM